MKVLRLVKDIMDIVSLSAKFTSKQSLTVVGAISALVIGLNQYPDPPQAAPGPVGKQEEVMSVADGVLPQGYNPNAVIRDPFAMPSQFQQQTTNAIPANVGRNQQAGKAREALPVVQGIVSAGTAKAAILAVGSDSRSYKIGERAGSYVITAIASSSVTLQGPEDTVVVPIGR